ncbi:MAG: NUDIX domain-containing protein [Flavobacteriales bacterium]|nr:NUDIX domain-containing protein [Flavobacteriales bacterium]
MYKVFINNKSVVLTDRRIPDDISDHQVYLVYQDFEEIHYVINLLDTSEDLQGAVFYHDNLPLLWADFRAHFKEIDAGGGLVRNDDNQFLLIFRKGKWDLPKGKIEQGESKLEGSLREVEEECGVKDLVAGDELVTTYHTYDHKGSRILKRTYWFEMTSNQSELTPQQEEDIERVEWMHLNTAAIEELDTYPNIKLLLKSTIDRL